MKRAFLAFACLAVVIATSACGGGGGGSSSTNGGGNGGGTTGTTLLQFLYVGNRGSNPQGSITVFELFTGGALTQIAGSPFDSDITPTGLAVSADGQYLYVSHITPNVVSQYRIEAGGGLTPLSPATVATAGVAWNIFAHPTKASVYVLDSTNNRVYQYTIDANGQLQPMATAFLATSGDPRNGAFHPSGDTFYLSCRDGAIIDQFTVNADGSLSPHATPNVPAGLGAAGITLTNNGIYAYVANELAQTVSMYSVNVATHSLVPNGTLDTDVANLASMTYNDQYFYTANYDTVFGPSVVLQYAIQPNGTLIPLAPFTRATGEGAMPIFVAPGTNFAYVANQSDGRITHYTVAANGQLNFQATYTTDQPGSTPSSFGIVDQSGP
jgi:6-phosphogluconolactonase (cycloisomerase 2 family)